MLAATLADPFFAAPVYIYIHDSIYELLCLFSIYNHHIIITLNETLKRSTLCLRNHVFLLSPLISPKNTSGEKKQESNLCHFLSTKPGCTTVPWHRFVSSTTYRLGRWYSTRNFGGADGRGGLLPHGDLSESSAGRFWDIEMREIYEKQIEKSMKNKWMKSTFLIMIWHVLYKIERLKQLEKW